MDHFVLIDGNSLVNRAFYATPAFTTAEGLPTNGIFGFLKLLFKIVDEIKPTYFAVAFDLPAPTFRHKLFDAYKGTRKPMPDDLAAQIPLLKETLRMMRIRTVELEGYEADDLIGTLAKRFPVHTVIYTGDRDSYQLVDETTDVYFTKRGVSDLLKLTNKNFKAEIGIEPKQIVDLKALMGDASDNIPGVPGVGEKTALRLILQYGSLEEVLLHAKDQPTALASKLTANRELAELSKTLATIDTAAPIDLTLQDCAFVFPFPRALQTQFTRFEFRSFLSLPIFEKEVEAPQTAVLPCADLSELAARYAQAESIAFQYDGAFHFAFDSTEVLVNVQKNLFDSGHSFEDCLRAAEPILCGTKTVLFYDYKAQKTALAPYLTVSCPHEDAALLHYLVESNGSNESLSDLMKLRSLPQAMPAAAIATLFTNDLRRAEEDTLRLYRELELPLADVLFDMEREGVTIDREQLAEFGKQYTAQMNEIAEKIYNLAGERFNLNSPMQLGHILFDVMGLPSPKRNKKGGYSTNAEVLERLESHEIVRHVQRYRLLQKLYSTYIEGFLPLIKADNKIHTTYNQTLTATGRLSSSNPNLQNIPTRNEIGKELRKLFLPCPGRVFLDADYSQIELRLLAHFSGCKELIRAYRVGTDIHTLTASQVFGVPLDAVTKDQRRRAKAVNFGIIYGISAFGLANDLHISTKEAGEYIDRYFESYSSVQEYMERNVAFAREHGYVTTLLGRKRMIPELKSSNYALRSFGERAARNMPLQGSAADIIKVAMLRVQERLKREKLASRLILQVHDELIIDTVEAEKAEVAEILRTEMEQAAKLDVPLEVEIGEGTSWYDAK